MQPVVAPTPRRRHAVALAAATAALALPIAVHELAPPRAPSQASPQPPSPTEPTPAPPWPVGPVVVVAIPAQTVVAPGQTLAISTFLVNRSDNNIAALPSLDASDDEWRFPKLAVEARDPTGGMVSTEDPEKRGRCGNINALRVEDFVIVRPGEVLDLTGEGTFGLEAYAPVVPGRYTMRVRYDLSFVGWDGATYEEPTYVAIEVLPRNIYFSNTFTIDVRAPAPP